MEVLKITKVVLVDDHKLFRKGMVELINGFSRYTVLWEAENGRDFIQKLVQQPLPDIVLLDVSMPIMDGYQTARWLEQYHPEVKVLALSMHDDDETILEMLHAGVNGYVLKNAEPAEVKAALRAMEQQGSYYTTRVREILARGIFQPKPILVELTPREIEFLKLACTELPYKSFAPLLKVNPRTVEDCRDRLFKKLEVVSRVGLVIYAIKHKIYKME
ncbi:response regulator transcription factor [Adhaeribacter pallidiroseus]|uniref:Transcriptional regulatory protein MctR n=1 Tax=Adhaeribacter pallidiroseus TaxID=2072847 RepID=A0A369QEY3_9BACT|nr:response regulator transcription factor [Adhaeribacter pallidiroseus]RDC62870.1 Transcriptional regulatory protein MctR [Adhaeribacter pallidiroseus]